MEYIYLDWNVIQYMKHSTIAPSIHGPDFRAQVKRLSKRFKFPFSEGHLRDLAKSFNQNNKENVDLDLAFLKEIANGYALGVEDQTEKIHLIEDVNINEFFNGIVAEIQSEPTFNISGESYSIDMESLPRNDLLRPFLENNNGNLDATVMTEFLQNLWQKKDDPEFYRSFRDQVAKIKENFEKRETVIDKNSKYFNEILPLLEFLTAKDPESYIPDFHLIIHSFCAINKRNHATLKMGEKIELAYMVLDFHPSYREKIDKKNKPSNVGRDCKNLFLHPRQSFMSPKMNLH